MGVTFSRANCSAVSLLVLAFGSLAGRSEASSSSVTAAQDMRALPIELLPVLSRAQDTGPANPAQVLNIAVSLPYAHPAEMQAFVDAVSDPSSRTPKGMLERTTRA